MSDYQGNIIIKNPAAPAGPYETGAAPGVWKLSEVLPFVRQGIWPTPGIPAPDTYFPYVSLLLSSTSLSNANNNLFVDSSGAFNPISRSGNTTQGSFTPYGASWSNYFDGTGDYLTVPDNAALDFGTSDFTIEMWINAQNLSTIPMFFHKGLTITGWFFQTSATTFYFGQLDSARYTTWSVSLADNVWYHIALTRVGAVLNVFVNGISQGAQTVTGANLSNDNSDVLNIGRYSTGAYQYQGYLSNYRVVKGSAVYTSNFTVPTSPLTAISGTSLLTCQSNRFRDASTNNFTISVFGNTSVTEFSPFAPAYPGIVYNQSDITNWSGYFDGSGDYINTAASSSLGLTGDWTVEGWLYQTSTAGAQIFLETRGSGATGFGIYCSLTGFAGGPGAFGYATNSALVAVSSTVIPLNTWAHLAVTRSGNTITGYINGVSQFTYTESRTLSSTMSYFIGADNAGTSNAYGYISNFRVVRGTAVYTGNFTPPTSPLTAISGTSLLTLQSAAFTDNSTNNFVVTINGNTTVTGNSPFNTVGYWSNYFDGSGDFLSAPSNAAFDLGSSSFTVECWFNANSFAAGFGLISRYNYTSVGLGWLITIQNSTTVRFVRGNDIILDCTVSAMSTGAWYHVAAVRNGSTLTVYLNGVQVGQATGISNFTDAATALQIGRTNTITNDINGYISNARVVKGAAVYTSAFTPSTTPLTAITNTSLLTCQNGRFIDNSTNAFTITRNGDVSVQSFDPFYTSTIASNGGSMYFDGTGDYLSVPSAPTSRFTGSFTIEFWVNFSSVPSSYIALIGGTTANTQLFITTKVNGNGLRFGLTGVAEYAAGTQTWSTNTWYHVALVRNGTDVKFYVNGTNVSDGTYTNSTSYSGDTLVGGNLAGTVNFPGYIADLRFTNGTAVYTAAFTPPTAPLTPSANTTLLVNGMNAGAYDATAINNMETVGNAQVSTVQSKFGGSSAYFDGSGDGLKFPSNTPMSMGTGNFTWELWVRATAASGYQSLIDTRTAALTDGFFFGIDTGTLRPAVFTNATVLVSSTSLTANTWQHLALVRSSGTLTIYLNGTSIGSVANSTNLTSGAGVIGASDSIANPNYFNGYIDDMRITRGIARYTTTFTPPTQAFPPY